MICCSEDIDLKLKGSMGSDVSAQGGEERGCNREPIQREKSCYTYRSTTCRCNTCSCYICRCESDGSRIRSFARIKSMTIRWLRSSLLFESPFDCKLNPIISDVGIYGHSTWYFFWKHWKWISYWNLFILAVILQLHIINMLNVCVNHVMIGVMTMLAHWQSGGLLA